MEIININKDKESRFHTGVALGNFDGLHLGHRALISSLIKKCREMNLKPAILMFLNHTLSLINSNSKEFQVLTSNEKKFQLLKDLGIEIVYTIPFNEKLRSLNSLDFVEKILIDKLNIKLATIGFDYRFAYQASGNSDLLLELGKKYNFEVNIIEPFYVDGELISSTSIRQYIRDGNIDKANKLLGSLYSINGIVVPGESRGKKLGFPTANIKLLDPFVLPKTGVYLSNLIVKGRKYQALTNIGFNPTFGGDTLKVENYILDFHDLIYDQEVEIQFKEFLRDDIKFASKEELIQQMNKDLEYAKNKTNIYKSYNI